MRDNFKQYLFNKNILVNDSTEGECSAPFAAYATLSLASLFAIIISEGAELANTEIVSFVERMTGTDVPEPFYRGFPESVRELSVEEQLIDRLVSYVRTYGMGDFSEPCHSILEKASERSPLHEKGEEKSFRIVNEKTAETILRTEADNLMCSSRALSDSAVDFLKSYIDEYAYLPERCASKNTAMKLLSKTEDLYYVRFLTLSDCIKLAEIIENDIERDKSIYEDDSLDAAIGLWRRNIIRSQKEKRHNVRLSSRGRKLLTRVLDEMFASGSIDNKQFRECCEKKKAWSGILHHIHYNPKNDTAKAFLTLMRGRRNISAYSEFERHMSEGHIKEAVDSIVRSKGQGALLRNLDYILSRCKSPEDTYYVVESIDTDNLIILWQLSFRYKTYTDTAYPRTFMFVKNNLLCVHQETPDEQKHRKSYISDEVCRAVADKLENNLRKRAGGRLGKVYINPQMKKIAMPIQEAAGQGGSGVLPKGSHVPMDEGRIIRVFTYWEKVNDIDLSGFGISEDGSEMKEFSWRSVWSDEGTLFSGDETSGYEGGSEYYDIDMIKFRERNPNLRYLIFCNNVYSGQPFSKVFCIAGYMVRDNMTQGEIYEPKTVKSSFNIDCDSTEAYLFAIDMEENELIWINEGLKTGSPVAGSMGMQHLMKYMHMADYLNYYTLFEMLAEEVTDDPMQADIVVSDENEPHREGARVIRSTDTALVTALMNGEELKA